MEQLKENGRHTKLTNNNDYNHSGEQAAAARQDERTKIDSNDGCPPVTKEM